MKDHQETEGGLLLPATACPDWDIRLQNMKMPISTEKLPLKTEAADRISWIFNQLVVPDIEGKPFVGDIPETTAWIDTVGRALFGGPEIREALVLIPKKQNKTSGCSLLYLAAFLGNKAPRLQHTILAPTVSIANFAFDQIVGALEADQELREKVHIRLNIKEIEHHETHAKLAVKAASLDALTGLKGSVFLDELHVWGAMREGSKLRQQLRGALMANPAARSLYITTQSDDEPAGIFKNMLSHARRVRDGKTTAPDFLPVTYEPWPGCDPWTDPDTWPRLLPTYPFISGPEDYNALIAEAKTSGATAIAEAKSQFFNIEIGAGEAGRGWNVAESFSILTEDFDLEDLIALSQRLSIGIDLGGAADMTALVVLGVGYDGVWRAWVRCWLTKTGLKEQNVKNESRFTGYVDSGDLKIIEPGADVDEAVTICVDTRESGKLIGVGVDPAGAADLADALEGEGFVMEENLHGVGQSAFRLAPAVRTTERRAERGKILFAKQSIMGWTLSNVIVRQKGNAPAIEKQYALDRIDPVMALLDAVTVEIYHKPEVVDVEAMIG